ncbi:MAG: hypothetical protein WCK86_21690, partial [Planctomycetia bacterium]
WEVPAVAFCLPTSNSGHEDMRCGKCLAGNARGISVAGDSLAVELGGVRVYWRGWWCGVLGGLAGAAG